MRATAYQNDAQHFAAWLSQTRGESYATMQAFVRAITPTDVRAYRAYLLNVQHTLLGTINHRLTTLHVLVRWARHAGLIEGDPVNGIKAVQQVKLAPRWLDRQEQYALRRAAEKDGNPRNLAILLVLLSTGLRVGEVADLKLDDLTLSERKGEVVVRGKGTKVRTVPLNAEARKALREYLAKRPNAEHTTLFVGQKGEPLGKLGLEYQIGVLGRLAGLAHHAAHAAAHLCQEPGRFGCFARSGGDPDGTSFAHDDRALHLAVAARPGESGREVGRSLRDAKPAAKPSAPIGEPTPAPTPVTDPAPATKTPPPST